MSVLEEVCAEALGNLDGESTISNSNYSEKRFNDVIYSDYEEFNLTEEMKILKDASKRAYFLFTRGLVRIFDNNCPIKNGPGFRWLRMTEEEVATLAKEMIKEFNENGKVSNRNMGIIGHDVTNLLKYGKSKNHVGRGTHKHPDVYRRWIPAKWAYLTVTERFHKPDGSLWILDRLENPLEGNPFARYDIMFSKYIKNNSSNSMYLYKIIGYYYFARDYFHYATNGDLGQELDYTEKLVNSIVSGNNQYVQKSPYHHYPAKLDIPAVGEYTPEKHLYNLSILGATNMKNLLLVDSRADIEEKVEQCIKVSKEDRRTRHMAYGPETNGYQRIQKVMEIYSIL